jgi:hypothetical protein
MFPAPGVPWQRLPHRRSIGQSAYFTGTLVSTCYFQLWLAGLLVSSLIVLLLHPSFWELVVEYVDWPISILVIICWHIASQITLNKWVTDGKTIKKPFLWLFAYVALSAAYCVVRLPGTATLQLVYTCISCATAALSSFVVLLRMQCTFCNPQQHCAEDAARVLHRRRICMMSCAEKQTSRVNCILQRHAFLCRCTRAVAASASSWLPGPPHHRSC